ncbi:MAG: glycosyltransferase family 2 protein [Clostridia bacterium]|nr:glycosyltransferase family 2 protein [Clostridia bacterium]
MEPTLYFVIPCYNEEEVLPLSAPVFLQKLDALTESGRIGKDSRILFVDDGSKDGTWEILRRLHRENDRVACVRLARNSGEQNALLAGMFTAADRADCVVTMDCDLQDDIHAVDEMLDRFEEGNEIVFGVRFKRDKDPFFQRLTSGLFYRLMHLMRTGIIEGHSNFRLMSRRAVELLQEYKETDFFLPGLVAKLGLKSATVQHERFERAAGKTNYNFMRLLRLAMVAVATSSRAPLHLIAFFAVLSGAAALASLIVWIVLSIKTGAFRTDLCILTCVWAAATLALAAMRVIGGYLMRTYFEEKRRPRYQIETTVL